MITICAHPDEYKKEKFRDYILNNKLIDGIFIDSSFYSKIFYDNNSYKFPNSVHNITTDRAYIIEEYKKVKKYFSETLTVVAIDKGEQCLFDICDVAGNIARFSPNCIVDEPEIKALLEMQNKTHFPFEVSLSSYRNLLFSFPVPKFLWQTIKLTRIRIYGWNSQLNNWKKIDKLFPKMQKSVNIHLSMNKKHFKELISYALENKKRIMLYAGDLNMDYDYNLFFTELEKQLKNHRVNNSIIGSWL